VNVHVVVKHHPARAGLLPQLLAQFDGLPVTVVTDPGAGSSLRSCWRCMRECLENVPEGASHVLVAEDDVVTCKDFAAGLERLVHARPDELLALWVGHNHARYGDRLDGGGDGVPHWLRLHPICVPVVAPVFPVGVAHRLREFERRSPQKLHWWDDNDAVTRFAVAEHVRVLAPQPSLVEHPDVVESVLTGEQGRGRRAHWFVPPYRSALELDLV
jgi:hypothetical protein